MTSSFTHILQRMVNKVARRGPLSEDDRQALLDLPYRLQTFEPNRYIVREGNSSPHSALIISGYAYRQKLTIDGARQIVSFHIPGDFIDLQAALMEVADHNVQALTRCELALVPVQAVRALLQSHPAIANAMWVDTLVDASIFREWVMNVGRRNARERISHLLCEFARRLELAGLASPDGYEFPMTQEQLADATGLTAVHVNRTLKSLDKDGLIVRSHRFISIPDWERLRTVAGFNDLYLHPDLIAVPADGAATGGGGRLPHSSPYRG